MELSHMDGTKFVIHYHQLPDGVHVLRKHLLRRGSNLHGYNL